VIATHLADASAWNELHHNDVAARLVSLLVGGGAATCGVVDLEVLEAFDDPAARAEVAAERAMFPRVAVDDAVLDRAIEVQGLLGQRVPTTALIVAAAAERAGLVLLHHDDAYDRIAAVTHQPVERIAL
jgi:predicted nucleic acid-binding protein